MRKADNLPPSRAVVTKSGKRNFLEPSGTVQAVMGLLYINFYRRSKTGVILKKKRHSSSISTAVLY